MQIGIFAKTFPGSNPLDVLQAARDAGYRSVQYNMACSGLSSLPTEVSDDVAGAVAEASRQTGVTISAISATYNMIHPDLSVREAGRRSFEAIAAQAKRIGSQLLTVCTGSCDAEDQWRHHPDNETGAAWSEMIKEFRLLVQIADRYDIRIGVEPELANVINSAHKARTLLDTMASDRIVIVFDPANLFEQEEPDARRSIIETAVHLLEHRIEIAHAKDRNADGTFATAGKGVIDYPHYVAALRGAGFRGDIITHGLAANEAAGVSTFLNSVLDRP
ncbi:sugar phosphate isomerase/epimerase family protein [Rhizobium mongolense]|uniref:Sugar phosphate isomerase/epimerase n=2 Tax=Rhizobium mongolense TaxID=57676 RepID=A0ABR6IJC2_9HYPH|nr:sugar phosphate isomerase/epimerase [Rhizobium mongolense]MBB4227983.1 sugar phosphate isomerase/epimerase [Rhizobium mongolense]TVZ64865.1 sugar phosphate isomerase/epimerase [Rhizobium mongolense USDA 1844]